MLWDGIEIVSKQISKLFNWYQYAQYSMLIVDMIIDIMWNDICGNMFWDDIEIILHIWHLLNTHPIDEYA
jgi:hypothetical protein